MPTFSEPEFHLLLRQLRERAGLTQDRAAAQLGVSRPNFAQWEAGKHLPAEERVRVLDDLLGADGALLASFGRARGGSRGRPVEEARSTRVEQGRPLLQVFRDIRGAVMEQLVHDGEGQPLGWRHNLVPSDRAPTALSTAYVLKALTVLGGLDPGTTALVGRLFDMADRDEAGLVIGWRASTAARPRIEMTALVYEALQRIGADLDVDRAVQTMRDLYDDTARTRPIILTITLDAVLRLAPDSGFAVELADALLALRVERDGVLVWPEKVVDRRQPMLEPSVAHTARAVNALRDARGDAVQEAVRAAEDWLNESPDLNGVSESVARDLLEGRREEVTFHSFTSAHVVRALAGASTLARPQVERALAQLWGRYDPELHLWAWGNGDVPAWMLMDAVTALHDAALAMTSTPTDE